MALLRRISGRATTDLISLSGTCKLLMASMSAAISFFRLSDLERRKTVERFRNSNHMDGHSEARPQAENPESISITLTGRTTPSRNIDPRMSRLAQQRFAADQFMVRMLRIAVLVRVLRKPVGTPQTNGVEVAVG